MYLFIYLIYVFYLAKDKNMKEKEIKKKIHIMKKKNTKNYENAKKEKNTKMRRRKN